MLQVILDDTTNRRLDAFHAEVNPTRLITPIDKSITICIQNLVLLVQYEQVRHQVDFIWRDEVHF